MPVLWPNWNLPWPSRHPYLVCGKSLFMVQYFRVNFNGLSLAGADKMVELPSDEGIEACLWSPMTMLRDLVVGIVSLCIRELAEKDKLSMLERYMVPPC